MLSWYRQTVTFPISRFDPESEMMFRIMNRVYWGIIVGAIGTGLVIAGVNFWSALVLTVLLVLFRLAVIMDYEEELRSRNDHS